MIKTFFILFTVIVLSFPANIKSQGYWGTIQSPTDKLLRHVCFVDSSTGWAAGRDGIIIHTTDSGQSWIEQNSTVQTFIIYIYFINRNVGWALTIRDVSPFGTIILSTTNGGDEWIATDYPEDNIFMNTVFFFDSLNGFLGGSKIVRTTDGGLNWLDVNVDSNMVSTLPIHRFKFFTLQFGYACGGFIDLAGVIWRTTDYGLNWTATGVSPDQVFDLYIVDSLNAITLSGDPEGFFGVGDIKTTDAGESWIYNQLPIFALSFAIDFRTSTEGWSASGYQFLRTTDRGVTWVSLETPDSSVIYDLTFTDFRTGYAVGDNGTILKYFLKPSVMEIPPVATNPYNKFLLQNFPNPFTPSTKIRFTIPHNLENEMQKVSLKVYDILGCKVKLLSDEELSPGEYDVEFNADELPAGLYICQLKVGSAVQSKKMIYLK